jgi:tRNA uridine 5-carboxymethylaminomethyl modification enzyme
LAMLRTSPALAKVRIMRAGYAVEYDFVPPTQISASLETKRIQGLFHAGQINGTSGYEEAAAQGLLAGMNAARKVQGKEPVILRRDQAYIGVLIDDIVTKEITEPYRILTSRAEHRLLLRQDNADLRLSPLGYELGLISGERYRRVVDKRNQVTDELERLEKTWLPPSPQVNAVMKSFGWEPLSRDVNALQLLRRPEVNYDLVAALSPGPAGLRSGVIEQITIQAKYAGYIQKQQREIERIRRLEEWRIPPQLDYAEVVGLRNEALEKLGRFRPATVGQAARIQGVNPADISILLIHLRRSAGQEDSY